MTVEHEWNDLDGLPSSATVTFCALVFCHDWEHNVCHMSCYRANENEDPEHPLLNASYFFGVQATRGVDQWLIILSIAFAAFGPIVFGAVVGIEMGIKFRHVVRSGSGMSLSM